MGAYNVITADDPDHPCPRCESAAVRVQFKFGNCWQLEYRLGDTVAWGGNDCGEAGLARVTILGEAEYCAVCGLDLDREYAIDLAEDRLTSMWATTATTAAPLRELERRRGW